jgi:hypothetical protein
MGASVSSTEVKNLTNIMNNVIMQTIQSCVTQVSQTQDVHAANYGFQFGNSTGITQNTIVKSDCFSDTQKQTDLQNQLIDTIKNYSTASGVGIVGIMSASVSESNTRIENNIRNSVKMENIQKNYNAIMQAQGVNITNYGVQFFGSTQVVQGAQVFAQATMQEIAKTGLLDSIKTSIDQTSTATVTNPLEALAGLFGSIGMAIFAVIGFIIFIFIAMGMFGSS